MGSAELATPRAAWIAGATGVAPFLVGTIPFGLVTDTGFAMFMREVADKPDMAHRHWYFLGGGMLVLHGLNALGL